MNIFGLSITRQKAPSVSTYPAVPGSGGWWNIVRESFPGAWQRNIEINTNTVLTYSTVFACLSLISSDIAKMRMRLVREDDNGIWNEVRTDSPFKPVLRKPNHYQTSIRFFANWVESKLIHGNTYVLKERDNRGGIAREVGVVKALYILDPTRVTVLCAPDGSIFYELRSDHLSGLTEEIVTVPASEIIHDRWNTFFHPLVGVSPLTANGLAATQGLRIQENSTKFFASGSHPAGLLTTPGNISAEQAVRIKERWDKVYGPEGTGIGSVAVLGNDFKYTPLMISSADSQLIEQLKWTSETVCSVFHVPTHMVGIGPAPSYNNIEALNQAYYSQCLQILIEDIEKLLDEGLGLGEGFGNSYGTEFDLEGLLRMDTATKVKAAAEAIKSSAMSIDEARKRWLDLGPVVGGDTPYMQQQNFSLAALAERDKDKPFSKSAPSPVAVSPQETEENGDSGDADDESEDEEDGEEIARTVDAVEWPEGSGTYWFSEAELRKAQEQYLADSFLRGVKQIEYSNHS